MKNRNLHYYIQTLSPVHVGSGEKLQKGLDYFSLNNHTWMIDRRKLEQVFVKDRAAFEEFTTSAQFNVHSLTEKHDLIAVDYPVATAAREMFEFIRTGMGVPYLPGSSIKGALRTIILWKLSQENGWQQDHARLIQSVLEAETEGAADNAIVEKAFNVAVIRERTQDPNRDLMRVLQVNDSHFTVSDIEPVDVRIFNLTSETQAGWKRMGRESRNMSSPREATPLAAEALKVGALAPVTLTISDFLLKSEAAKSEAGFHKHLDLFNELPSLCNAYAKRQIQRQRKFFEPFGNIQPIVAFYDELEKKRSELSNGDFMLRLSWGSGWHGMTGEWVEEPDELLEVRKAFDMGGFIEKGTMPDQCPNCGSSKVAPDKKADEQGFCHACKKSFPVPGLVREPFPVFPKTRKIAVQGNQPVYPFGWAVLTNSKPEQLEFTPHTATRPPAYRAPNQPTTTGQADEAAIKRIEKEREEKRKQAQQKMKVGDKIRAVVFKVEGSVFYVRLLQIDKGRELSFEKLYTPVKLGDTIEVRIRAIDPAGLEVIGVEFVKKII